MTSENNAKAISLLDEGRAYLDAGDKERAEDCFRTAASISDLPAARNNWALCRYLAGAYASALQILAPVLAGTEPAPFTRALASMALTASGEPARAKRELEAAIRDLDDGLREAQWRQADVSSAWAEYTVPIKQAAGALGQDRLVLDLHGRWPGRDLPVGAFAAGVAAFHLGRYEQAAKYWERIAEPGWRRSMNAYASVARMAAAGLVPPFRLEYELNEKTETAGQPGESPEAMAERGSVRVRMLAYLMEPDAPDKGAMAEGLIGAAGQWGRDLGHRLLSGSTVPTEVKMGAARALVDAGEFAPNEPIPIILQGRPTSIVLKQIEVQSESAEAEATVERARLLRDSGKPEQALRLLNDLSVRGIAYPPAMMMQANLMRSAGELDTARSILESLERIAPDNPAVLFNLAGLWMQYKDLARARSYAERIETAGETRELQRMVADMKAWLRQADIMSSLPSRDDIANAMREQTEEKPISLNVTLAAALKQIPVEWLNAAATLHELLPARRRAEREKSLAAALKDPVRVRAALAAESADVRACLQYLLQAGGWCKLQALTKRFGSLDPDGFFWDEQPPTSPAGRLRVLGLVFVGRAVVDSRRYKVAVVPAELRAVLTACV